MAEIRYPPLRWPFGHAVMAMLLLAAGCCGVVTAPPACPSEQLAQYRVELSTFWSREAFPKHYPQWRPHAQWTKLLGKPNAQWTKLQGKPLDQAAG